MAVDSPVVLKPHQRQRKTENLAMMAARERIQARLWTRETPLAVCAQCWTSLVDQQAWLKRWFGAGPEREPFCATVVAY
ncbi:MAG: hypothetical protein CM15mP25_2630 [Gammaproteobacteria bacterium]|nr:MAG: hypothetical protein CM15mP25_2630 [Gammaproteobacteria bacterium]